MRTITDSISTHSCANILHTNILTHIEEIRNHLVKYLITENRNIVKDVRY